ncbi:hypothetical protein LOTGIDRAFT_238296 [Lottia gigantea]|uniref:F-box domain-containing protein n=1 Tax=Lottia gigantea TaxID=225164 RepID=V4AVV3_LOTGI|nr:hypothetical protein LOTGIDRAFT_238296 [Lottia gigantea]ESP01513.1 hypothetical protein LOTGIDRAFT_238296 [Lottia gigantea]
MSLAVEMFLNQLSRIRGTKILSFKIDYMDFYHGWRFFEMSRSRLIGALCKFIRKQRHLQFLDVSGSQIDTRDGSRVLKALAACYARNTIKTLQMKDFFEMRYNATNNSSFLTALKKFTALKEIYINFIYLNPSILEILGKKLGNCLELIRLVVDSSESQARTITASDWTRMREKCPKLKVVFHFLGLLSYNEYTSALCRGIPLVECDILSWEGYPNDLEPDTERMSDILRHVANNFNKTLARFRLSIDHCSSEDSLDQPMILMLQKCCYLTEFTVNATLSLETVDILCKIAAARKPKRKYGDGLDHPMVPSYHKAHLNLFLKMVTIVNNDNYDSGK